MAEWLRRWTDNLMGTIPGTGDFFVLIFFMMMMGQRTAAQASAKRERRRFGMSAVNVGASYHYVHSIEVDFEIDIREK